MPAAVASMLCSGALSARRGVDARPVARLADCSRRATACHAPAHQQGIRVQRWRRAGRQREVAASAAAADRPGETPEDEAAYALSEDQRRSMTYSSTALRRWGWVSFWIQLALSLVSAVILLFSAAYTSVSGGPRISMFMVVFAVLASFLSTFWSFGYVRLAQRIRDYAEAYASPEVERKVIKKAEVKLTLRHGLTINVIGMGSALLGLQAMVGMLVAKTLTSASSNPFFAGTASSHFNQFTGLDVFLVQAATNTLLSHFVSLVVCFLLLRAVDQS